MSDIARRGGIPHRGVSQAQVAAHAGVSAQTVSRVANQMENVDPETRDRVLDSMRALGYRLNRTAVALRSGEYRTIGVIMFTLASFGNARTWESLALAADRSGYSVALTPVDRPTGSAVRAAFSRLAAQSIDGVIVLLEDHLLGDADPAMLGDVPVVVIDSAERHGASFVDADQAMGARQATEHLLALGHPTVWHIAGPESFYSAVRREASWRHTLESRGCVVPPVLRGDWTAASGYRAGLALRENPEVSAVFVANDQMALGLLRAFHETGVDVPGHVSVVGFDDMPESADFWPPLTTVRQDFETVGRVAVERLLDAIAARDHDAAAATRSVIPTTLIDRASTAPFTTSRSIP